MADCCGGGTTLISVCREKIKSGSGWLMLLKK